jgi:hypothetical protein
MENDKTVNHLDYAWLRDSCVVLEAKWGVRPILTLSCVGGADEHWQFFHPDSIRRAIQNSTELMPDYVLVAGGLEGHPDAAHE